MEGDPNEKEISLMTSASSSSSSSSSKHHVPDGGVSDARSSESSTGSDVAVANGEAEEVRSSAAAEGDAPSPSASVASAAGAGLPSVIAASTGETIDVKVVWNKNKYDVVVRPEETVLDLKTKMQELTGLAPSMQKIMFKGLCKDDRTMKDLKVTKGTKIMMVGSTLDDVIAVSTTPSAQELKDGATGSTAQKKSEPLSKQKPHTKVTEKGPPEDAIPGILLVQEPLPPQPLSGMLNKSGGKVRLTFKLEADEVWIGTKERTDKVPMSSIKAVVSEPISGHERYHMLALQLGPTEASRYWIYWVPAQYVEAIKRTILG